MRVLTSKLTLESCNLSRPVNGGDVFIEEWLLVLLARCIYQLLCRTLCTLTPDKLSAVSYVPLTHSRHNAEDSSVKVGREMNTTMNIQHVLLLNCRYTWSNATKKCCVGRGTLQVLVVVGKNSILWKAIYDYWPPDLAVFAWIEAQASEVHWRYIGEICYCFLWNIGML